MPAGWEGGQELLDSWVALGGGTEQMAAGLARTQAQTALAQAQADYQKRQAALDQQNYQLELLQVQVNQARQRADAAYQQGNLQLAQVESDRAWQLNNATLQLQQQVAQASASLDRDRLNLDQQVAQYNAQYGQQQLGQQQYEFAAEQQRDPINWIQSWQASRGMPFEVGEQSFNMPELMQPNFTQTPTTQTPTTQTWTDVLPSTIPTNTNWQTTPTPAPTYAPTPALTPTSGAIGPDWIRSPQPVYNMGTVEDEYLYKPSNYQLMEALAARRGPLIAAVMRGDPGAREELDLLNEQYQQLIKGNQPVYDYNIDVMTRLSKAQLPPWIASQLPAGQSVNLPELGGQIMGSYEAPSPSWPAWSSIAGLGAY